MKTLRLFLLLQVIALSIIQVAPARAQFGELFEGFKKVLGVSGDLSEGKIIEGLKEALQIGTKNAVEIVSQSGGYYENPKIKIPLPDAVQRVEKLLRGVGYGAQLDAFELSMNRAAEKAAPEAKDIFWEAIRQLSFADARNILQGKDNEATIYFKEKTYDSLGEIFKPIAHNAMSDVGVTRNYQKIDEKVRSMPFVGEILSFDLDEYVTNGALEGLFLMLAEEEKKIRQDPSARVTDLLKQVFGSQ